MKEPLVVKRTTKENYLFKILIRHGKHFRNVSFPSCHNINYLRSHYIAPLRLMMVSIWGGQIFHSCMRWNLHSCLCSFFLQQVFSSHIPKVILVLECSEFCQWWSPRKNNSNLGKAYLKFHQFLARAIPVHLSSRSNYCEKNRLIPNGNSFISKKVITIGQLSTGCPK